MGSFFNNAFIFHYFLQKRETRLSASFVQRFFFFVLFLVGRGLSLVHTYTHDRRFAPFFTTPFLKY